jgi:23S rRNA (uridine2552-2'-O)-methyltransferase
MAPNTTGAGDDLISARLCRVVLDVLPGALKKGGALVMKVLEGAEYPALLQETRELFTDVKGLKPKASRDVSREMFIIATGFKGVGE